jgi:hypothetical protein
MSDAGVGQVAEIDERGSWRGGERSTLRRERSISMSFQPRVNRNGAVGCRPEAARRISGREPRGSREGESTARRPAIPVATRASSSEAGSWLGLGCHARRDSSRVESLRQQGTRGVALARTADLSERKIEDALGESLETIDGALSPSPALHVRPACLTPRRPTPPRELPR